MFACTITSGMDGSVDLCDYTDVAPDAPVVAAAASVV